MRQIKFRAWSEYEKKMIYDANSDIKIYLNGAISKDGNWETSWLKIMQFIGAYDKNGKEIYEGDIVDGDWQNDFGSYTRATMQILFCDGKKGFEAGNFTKGGFPHFSIGNPKELEIIGNIYENPELLKS